MRVHQRLQASQLDIIAALTQLALQRWRGDDLGCCGDRLNSPTRESAELATLKWVAWFNRHHLTEPLRYIPTAKAEANYCLKIRNITVAPALN